MRARAESADERGKAPSHAGYNLRIAWPLSQYIVDHHGKDVLAAIGAPHEVEPRHFEETSHWVSASTLEAILAAIRETVGDERTYRTACTYRMKEAYGPLRYVLWATSPFMVFSQAAKMYRLVSTVGVPELKAEGPTAIHLRIKDAPSLSRLTCVLRQEQSAALTTMWGLPPAMVREDACIAHGDATCEIHFRWYDYERRFPVIVGAFLGVALSFGLSAAHIVADRLLVALTFALIGALIGYFLEFRRADRLNKATREEVMSALRNIADNDAAARRELVELHSREKNWTRMLEEEAAERDRTIDAITRRLEDTQEERTSHFLGAAHDLKSPLSVIKMAADLLRDEYVEVLGKEGPGLVGDLEAAVAKMTLMLNGIRDLTTAQRSALQLTPQRVDVPILVEQVRRRITALAYGRPIRPTVFNTREAPASIEIDTLVLDRIIDNIISNAAKYTERGSIVIELDGVPGFLVLKVSDTGRGMEEHLIERIFQPGGSDPTLRAKNSWGVGLSVVVQLLDRIGGRLEVMSKIGRGTTFWVYLPQAMATRGPSGIPATRAERVEGPLSNVVKIRKAGA